MTKTSKTSKTAAASTEAAIPKVSPFSKPAQHKSFRAFSGSGMVGTADLVNSATIRSVILDRLSGVTVAEPIWSGRINTNYVSRMMTDSSIRQVVASFFTRRMAAKLIPALVGANNTRVSTNSHYAIHRAVVQEINKLVDNSKAAGVIAELILGGLLGNGIVAEATTIMHRYTYPLTSSVTIQDLCDEILKHELMSIAEGCSKLFKLSSGSTYSTAAVGDLFSDAFFSVGSAIRNHNDFSSVVEDVVFGVRAVIDPELTGLTGDVPSSIRDHDVVQQLSSNLTFVRAALSIAPGSAVQINSDSFKFDKWAPMLLALLKTSDRYVIVNKTDLLKTYGLIKVRKSNGCPVTALVYNQCALDPVALSITAEQDCVMPDCIAPDVLGERTAEHVAAAFNQLPKVLTTQHAVQLFHDLARDAAEADGQLACETFGRGIYLFSPSNLGLEDMATLLAERVLFKNNVKEDDLTLPLCSVSNIVYAVKTCETLFEPSSGVLLNGYAYTSDPAEVLMLVDEFTHSSVEPARPQLLPRAAMKQRLLGVDLRTEMISVSNRISFAVDVYGVAMRGSLRLSDFTSFRTGHAVSLVTPMYNREVIQFIAEIYSVIWNLVIPGTSPLMVDRAKRMLGRHVTDLARTLAPSFRSEIHKVMIARSLDQLSPEEAVRFRSRCRQAGVAAYVDLFSLGFFLEMQGTPLNNRLHLSEDSANGEIFDLVDVVISDETCREAWAEYGTDRKE